MKIEIINGPNMNMLGIREPGIYGKTTYKDLCGMLEKYCGEKGVQPHFFQSNCEGELITRIHECYFEKVIQLCLFQDVRSGFGGGGADAVTGDLDAEPAAGSDPCRCGEDARAHAAGGYDQDIPSCFFHGSYPLLSFSREIRILF